MSIKRNGGNINGKASLIKNEYFDKIDGLRFVAIFFVLLEHFAPAIGKPVSAGYYGVDLFFVISGFLITSILCKENNKSFKTNYFNFIGRRTLRIFPIYYITIIILWILNFDVIRRYLWWFLTYTFNYAWVNYNLPNNPVTHFWSLSVEEQFYVFWPIIVLSLKRKKNWVLSITIIVVIVGYLQAIFNIFPLLSRYNNAGLLTRMASIGLGAVGAILSGQHLLPEKVFKNKFLEYFILLLLVVSLVTSFKFKVLILGLCSFYLVLKAAFYNFSINSINSFLKDKRIIYIGTISYGIYIFHPLIGYYLDTIIFLRFWNSIDFTFFPLLQWNAWIIKFPLYTMVSIAFAALSFKYIEKPFLNLKNRFFHY